MDLLLSGISLLAGLGPAVDLTTVRGMLGVVLGVGALIFFHELGHFMAAKWAGVKVEVFSLGFGHRLCGFEHNGTDYRISLLPLGGYVRMLGQADEDPFQAKTDREDDFRNKSVGKRFIILVAGVVMNLVLAAVGFIACFGLGVKFTAPQIGVIAPGSAASKADLQPGDIITHIDGKEILGWQDLATLVALADGEIELSVLRNGERHTTKATPFRGPNDSFAILGVRPTPVLADFTKGSRLEAAGARKVTATSSDRLLNVSPLSSRCAPGLRMTDIEIGKTLEKSKGKLAITLERTSYDAAGLPTQRELVPIEVDLERKQEYTVGLSIPDQAWVRELRKGSAADKAGLKVGDRILRLNGKEVRYSNLREIVLGVGVTRGSKPVPMVVERHKEGGVEEVALEVALELQNKEMLAAALKGESGDKERRRTRRAAGRWLLGVGYRADVVGAPCKLQLADPEAEAIELQPGDRLESVWFSGGVIWTDESKGFHGPRWLRIRLRGQKDKEIRLSWTPKGSKETRKAVLKAIKHPTATYPDLGIRYQNREVMVERGPIDAVVLGMQQTVIQTKRIFMMLNSFITGSVSTKELGGPIMIFNVAYVYASRETFSKLLHLLAILSVNLAVINILPIPVLDGGHIFFLMIEKLKGKPVSGEVLIYAQWFGLFCILGLMALVFFNDIRRLIQ